MPSLPNAFGPYYVQDLQKTRAKRRSDLCCTLVLILLVCSYATIQALSTLVEKQFVNVCSDEPTPRMLCEDWVFRQCSYHGDNVGVFTSSAASMSPAGGAISNPVSTPVNAPAGQTNSNNGGQSQNNGGQSHNQGAQQNNNGGQHNNQGVQPNPPSSRHLTSSGSECSNTQCNPLTDVGECPIMDVVNPAFCTTWHGGNMDTSSSADGSFMTYHPGNNCPSEHETGTITMTCCGAREMKLQEKFLAWLGLVGGIIGLIKTALAVASDQLGCAAASSSGGGERDGDRKSVV